MEAVGDHEGGKNRVLAEIIAQNHPGWLLQFCMLLLALKYSGCYSNTGNFNVTTSLAVGRFQLEDIIWHNLLAGK